MSIFVFNYLIVWVPFVAYLAILSIAAFRYFKRGGISKKFILFSIIIVLAILLAKAIIQAVSTYYFWKGSPLGQYMVPPQNGTYFYDYIRQRYFYPVISAVVSSLLLFLLVILGAKYKKGVYELKEGGVAFLCGLIIGWPNFLIYFGFTFILAIVYLVALRKIEKEIDLAPLWILAAILTLFLGKFINETAGLYLLKI